MINMAKKRRTAKQIAATRKLVALNKKRRSATKKSTKKKTSLKSRAKRVINKTKPRRTMKRRSSRKSSSRSKSLIPAKGKSLLKNVMIGLGAAATVSTIGGLINQPALGSNKLVSTGASYVVGGPIAAGITFLLGGGGLNLGGQQSQGAGI